MKFLPFVNSLSGWSIVISQLRTTYMCMYSCIISFHYLWAFVTAIQFLQENSGDLIENSLFQKFLVGCLQEIKFCILIHFSKCDNLFTCHWKKPWRKMIHFVCSEKCMYIHVFAVHSVEMKGNNLLNSSNAKRTE